MLASDQSSFEDIADVAPIVPLPATPQSACSMGAVSHESEFLFAAEKEFFYIVNVAGEMIEVEFDYETSLGTPLNRAKKKWLDVDKKLSKCSLAKIGHELNLESERSAINMYEIFDGWPGERLFGFCCTL